MKVILRDDIPTLGEAGEIVNVKDGYARNYLIPRNLAYMANKGNLKIWEDEKQIRMLRIARETDEAEKVKTAIETLVVEIEMQVGEEGRLFGSVTNRLVAEKLKEQHNFDMDHRHIVIDEPIRSQGEFTVNVRLAHSVVAELRVLVEAIGGEEEAPAEEAVVEDAPAQDAAPDELPTEAEVAEEQVDGTDEES